MRICRFGQIWLVCIFTLSCSTRPPIERLTNDPCEEFFLEKSDRDQIISTAKLSTGYAISYAFTGAAYATELTWNVVGTGGAIILLCTPAFAFSSAVGGPVVVSDRLCVPASLENIQISLGERAYEKSRNLRCPEQDKLSASFRKAAQCFKDKNTKEGKSRANDIINAITTSDQFYNCLSKPEKDAVLKLKGDVLGLW